MILNRKNSATDASQKDNTNYTETLKELEEKIIEIDKIEKKEKNIDLSKTQLKFIYDIIKDNTFFSILENLNNLSIEVIKKIILRKLN